MSIFFVIVVVVVRVVTEEDRGIWRRACNSHSYNASATVCIHMWIGWLAEALLFHVALIKEEE